MTSNRHGGVILGRFMPPHAGHEFLIHFAESYSTDLTVFLCSLAGEPIPGDVRLRWLREAFPNSRIVHLTQAIPEAARDRPGAPALWASAVRPHLPSDPEFVFASEEYGVEFARELGATFVPVDHHRETIPISAGEIRSDPLGHWSHILPVCRPFFALRISLALLDPSVARALAERLDTVLVPAPHAGHHDPLRVFTATLFALLRRANRVCLCEVDPIALTGSATGVESAGAKPADTPAFAESAGAPTSDATGLIAAGAPHVIIFPENVEFLNKLRYNQYGCRVVPVPDGSVDTVETAIRRAMIGWSPLAPEEELE